MKKKISRCIVMLFCCFILLLQMDSLLVLAENETLGVLMVTVRDVDVRTSQDNDSDVIATIPEGTAVIAIATDNKDIFNVIYKDINGYIQASDVMTYNTEEIAQEQKIEEQNNIRAMEEFDMEQKNKKSSLIFGVIIAFLVVGIFAIGVISAIKRERSE